MTETEKYLKAVSLMADYPEMQHFVGPRTGSVIDRAETALALTFPRVYRRFVSDYGCGNFGSNEIYGIITENFVNSSVPDTVWYTLNQRKLGLPRDYVVVQSSGDGWIYCLDCAVNDEDRNPVVSLYMPLWDGKDTPEAVFSGFGDFLLDSIQREISYKRVEGEAG